MLRKQTDKTHTPSHLLPQSAVQVEYSCLPAETASSAIVLTSAQQALPSVQHLTPSFPTMKLSVMTERRNQMILM